MMRAMLIKVMGTYTRQCVMKNLAVLLSVGGEMDKLLKILRSLG